MEPRRHDTAQICLEGHVVNDLADYRLELNRPRCEMCGEETITDCVVCKARIFGRLVERSGTGRVKVASGYVRPAYCYSCGAAHPWTERAKRAALELFLEASEVKPTKEEAEQFEQTLNDLSRDTARTPLAVDRFRRAMVNAGQRAADMIKDIVVNVASEAVNKRLWP